MESLSLSLPLSEPCTQRVTRFRCDECNEVLCENSVSVRAQQHFFDALLELLRKDGVVPPIPLWLCDRQHHQLVLPLLFRRLLSPFLSLVSFLGRRPQVDESQPLGPAPSRRRHGAKNLQRTRVSLRPLLYSRHQDLHHLDMPEQRGPVQRRLPQTAVVLCVEFSSQIKKQRHHLREAMLRSAVD